MHTITDYAILLLRIMLFYVIQDGNTALIYACKKDRIDVVEVLLNAGANGNVYNKVRIMYRIHICFMLF